MIAAMIRHPFIQACALAFCAGLSTACTGTQEGGARIGPVFYACDGVPDHVAVVFHSAGDTNSADLTIGNENLTLPRARSGSGARYAMADETAVFWIKGDDANMELPDRDPTRCHVIEKPG